MQSCNEKVYSGVLFAHQAWFTLPPRPLGRNGDGLIGHRAAVVALALSKSQGIAVSGSEDGSAIMWDLARCTSLQVLLERRRRRRRKVKEEEEEVLLTAYRVEPPRKTRATSC